MEEDGMTVRPRQLLSSQAGDQLGGCNTASLEIQLDAMIEQNWTSTWRWSIDGVPGADTLFICYLTWSCGNMTR
jgi:hypothetical protein